MLGVALGRGSTTVSEASELNGAGTVPKKTGTGGTEKTGRPLRHARKNWRGRRQAPGWAGGTVKKTGGTLEKNWGGSGLASGPSQFFRIRYCSQSFQLLPGSLLGS